MTDHSLPQPPAPTASFPLTAPVRLTGRDKRDAMRAYRVYLAGGTAAWDEYERLRNDGRSHSVAAAWALYRARAVAP